MSLVAAVPIALGALLWPFVVSGAGPRPDEPGAGAVAHEPPPIALPPLDAARVERLRRDVESAIAGAVSEAERVSRGRASGSNVVVAVHARIRRPGGPSEELLARLADHALLPASNMKLVTTAAALVLLGPHHELETRFESRGAVEGDVLVGDLVARAGGDPFYDPDAAGRVEERVVGPLAEALARLGVRRVRGDLLLDEGTFEAPGPGPGWPPANQHWTESCARSGGLTLNAGLLTASVTPGPVGGRATVEVHPAPHGLRELYGVDTVQGTELDVRVGATLSAVTVKGELGASIGPWSSSFAHPDPVLLFGHAVAGGLRRHGIELEGEVRRARDVPPGAPLARITSPLVDTLVPINTWSTNSVADQVFLATALAVEGEATRAAGARATARALERLGVQSAGLVQVDGSGLSRDDRATARQISALLDAVLARRDVLARAYRDSLAVAGRSGTLGERMRGTAADGRVHAKTGWIRGASALSGLTTTRAGSDVFFAILVGYPPEASGLNTRCFKPMHDEIATLFTELDL